MGYGRLIGKAEAIIATGMPGLYRVLAFMSIQNIYSLSDLGRAASAFSVAQILAFFTAIGWATLILARVPAAKDRNERVQRFYELLRMAVVSLLFCGLGVAVWSHFLKPEISGLEIVTIMLGWTFYQVTRHYFLSMREYRRVIAYDAFLLVATAGCIVAFHSLGMSAGLPLGVALAATGVLMLLNVGLPARFSWLGKFELKGIEFGFTNFLSGGVALSLVPIANYTDGSRFAGVISLFASISAISGLIPRAISMYRLPDLSRQVSAGKSLAQITAQTNREIMKASGGALLVNAFIVLGFALFKGAHEGLEYEMICSLAICAQSCLSMLSTAHSNVLMVCEESRKSMSINFISCGLFVAALGIFYTVFGGLNFAFVLVVCILVTGLRNIMLKRRSAPLLTPAVRAG
ncbi:hypothetical protein LMG28688_06379 [Paraburkholderia caffeinitolerans]|uniref:Polysaccharide biosynthesis protein C-terminal domain-containing protein n=1 Tax=Paraburkholderia caffeinitolerans TaxID=1723730 RepID=A0A6J5GUU0_9BURK|nr:MULTISPECIES: hypothetical protein [Paraburkholderia]CAB3806663.1 hypothetical protein LMG28688_06379 [Paraburkholderia caffeinitolerans]